jgi:hypothetical protein
LGGRTTTASTSASASPSTAIALCAVLSMEPGTPSPSPLRATSRSKDQTITELQQPAPCQATSPLPLHARGRRREGRLVVVPAPQKPLGATRGRALRPRLASTPSMMSLRARGNPELWTRRRADDSVHLGHDEPPCHVARRPSLSVQEAARPRSA